MSPKGFPVIKASTRCKGAWLIYHRYRGAYVVVVVAAGVIVVVAVFVVVDVVVSQ